MNTNIAESKQDFHIEASSIQNRIFLLGKKEQLIMTLYYKNQMSYREIALLLGVSRSTVLRRIIKIKRMLAREVYSSFLKNKQQFTASEMKIASDYFLKGHSIRKIARRKNTSYYKMRKKIKEIQYILDN